MLKENPNILIINTIYKINQYNLPYINMTGQIMIEISFFVGFFFIDKEDNADYNWFMGCLKALYNKFELLYPYVITTDNQRSLINTVMGYFLLPQIKHFFCFWYINKAVLMHYKPTFKGCDEKD